MKKISKKNQLIIAVLTLMIAGAGYANFALQGSKKPAEIDPNSESAFYEEDATGVYEENIELNSDEEHIGEAILTSADAMKNTVMTAKLSREQTRSKEMDNYLEVINDTTIAEETKQGAMDAYVKLNEYAGKEENTESALSAKGFSNAIVFLSDDSVQVTIYKDQLSENEKVQIEDVVTETTGYDISQVVISLVGEEN